MLSRVEQWRTSLACLFCTGAAALHAQAPTGAAAAVTGAAVTSPLGTSPAGSPATFEQAFAALRDRPELARSVLGVEVYSLDRHSVLFAWNGDKLFEAASTAKLVTAGALLHLLHPDFRFHTAIYRTGPLVKGVLHGDLVLIASGDPNLSGRRQPDDTLAYADMDHSYGGFRARLIGDPRVAIDTLAAQVAAAGIRKVAGQVRIDVGLFPAGARETGTGTVVAPIIVNDNVIDCLIGPGQTVGQPATLRISPAVGYVSFTNHIVTGAEGSAPALDSSERTLPDGRVQVTLTGTIAVHSDNYVAPYPVDSPSRFATTLLLAALHDQGIVVTHKPTGKTGHGAGQSNYTPEQRVAEWVSAPLAQEIKVTLKTSQNLHATVMPFVLGAELEGNPENGFEIMGRFLKDAGLDLAAASLSDGAGAAAHFTPHFVTRYLSFLDGQPEGPVFREALPILGKDGSLQNIEMSSPAAGHVFAKTGTMTTDNRLDNSNTVAAKGLAGYTTTVTGERVAFAMYVNNVPLRSNAQQDEPLFESAEDVGRALGALAAALNTLPLEPSR